MRPRCGYLQFLSLDEVERIHDATLQVLEEVGVCVDEETVLGILRDIGATVDFDRQTVRFPPWLVEDLVHKAPSRFTWCGRDPRNNIFMEAGYSSFGPMGGAIHVRDLNGIRRPGTLEDAVNFCRLIDGLENIDEVHTMVWASDVPAKAMYAHMFACQARYSTKPFKGRTAGRRQALESIRMAEIVAGGETALQERNLIIGGINTMSPLRHCRPMVEGMYEYARRGLPLNISAQVIAGITGPATLAGAITQANAEVLSGIAIVQAIRPGCPVAYGTVTSIGDMRTANIAYGAIEAGMFNAAAAQMARFYDVPSRGTAETDSKLLDMQAGTESAIPLLMAALGGTNYIHGAGGMESSLLASFVKLVYDDEVIGMVKRSARGFRANEDTLALDAIKASGPGGHYLTSKHTLQHSRSAQYIPTIMDRRPHDIWEKSGAKDVRQVAAEKARRLLAKHLVEPLDPWVDKELDQMVARAEEWATSD